MNNTKKSIIYIACPANTETGGPEALHTLAFEIKNLGLNVYMYYYGTISNQDPVRPKYKRFAVPYITEIDDNRNNILIIPETNTKIQHDYKNITKAIWWLSVDNYIKVLNTKNYKGFKKLFRKIFPKKDLRIVNFKDKNLHHFAQSYYAINFLKEKGAKNIYFLADYLSEEFISDKEIMNKYSKKDIVLYNPKKGYEFTQKLIEKAGNDIEFIPLINLTCAQVKDLCQQSKVYIDFGNHPGKDRFPRESALCGNIIITNLQGSAKFQKDVPLPQGYKFEDNDENINLIISKIKDCLENYDEKIKEFEAYRQFIYKDKENFINDIKNIFTHPKPIQ